MPGPPNEFAAVLNDHIVPWLQHEFPTAVPLELRVLTTQGIGESDIVTRLEDVGLLYGPVDVGFYPGFGKVEIRLTSSLENKDSLDRVEREFQELFQDHLI